MLNKLLNVRIFFTPSFLRHVSPKPAPPPLDEGPLPLRIIHAGGFVEYYYMAVPAIKIMEKYPSFLLARPDIFKRPWDSLVRSEEILTPGEKIFLVPRRTVQKLRRRIRKHVESSSSSSHGISDDDGSVSQHSKDEFSSATNHVRLSSLVSKHNSIMSKGQTTEGDSSRSMTGSQCLRKSGKKVRKSVMWHPTLTVIGEGSSAPRADD